MTKHANGPTIIGRCAFCRAPNQRLMGTLLPFCWTCEQIRQAALRAVYGTIPHPHAGEIAAGIGGEGGILERQPSTGATIYLIRQPSDELREGVG